VGLVIVVTRVVLLLVFVNWCCYSDGRLGDNFMNCWLNQFGDDRLVSDDFVIGIWLTLNISLKSVMIIGCVCDLRMIFISMFL
jgi:hypothetical protein